MADPKFHHKSAETTLNELAKIAEAPLHNEDDSGIVISDVAPLNNADESHISFLDNIKYKSDFETTKARACIISEKMLEHAPKGIALLISKNPYKSYAHIAQYFYPENYPAPDIAAGAMIDEAADIGQGCIIEAGAIIKKGAKIGAGSWIESGAIIGENVEIGKNSRIGTNASVSHSIIGDGARIYTGARIGQDGFGFAIDPAGHVKVPQLGRVIIEENVQIGANTCIDRGAGPDTIIGAGTWIDNLVQIAHNVRIGKGCIIIAHVGIAGSAIIEDYAVLAGQVGIAGHVTVGMGAQIAAQSGIISDVPAGEKLMGSPAFPIKEHLRHIASLRKLSKKK